MGRSLINKRMKFPKNYKSQDGKYGSLKTTHMESPQQEFVTDVMETEKNKAPLESIEIQNADIVNNSYNPQSDACVTLETVVPASMRYDMHKAIETIDRRVNGVDEFVAEKIKSKDWAEATEKRYTKPNS